MISIVICSINQTLLKEVSENIAVTIGAVEFEIIAIDNNVEQLSIFQAYNKGASKARFPFLLFIHEDILLKTTNWGQLIVDQFKDSQLGLLGIVGTKYKSKVPSGWYTHSDAHYGHLYYNNGKKDIRLQYKSAKATEPVVAVDGLFMATTKEVYQQCRFDEETYKGFHFYDLDYATSVVSKKFKVAITNQLDIFHHSQGNKNVGFYQDMFAYQRKWKNILPLTTSDQKLVINVDYEWSSFIRFSRLVFKFEKTNASIKERITTFMPASKSILYAKFILLYWLALTIKRT